MTDHRPNPHDPHDPTPGGPLAGTVPCGLLVRRADAPSGPRCRGTGDAGCAPPVPLAVVALAALVVAALGALAVSGRGAVAFAVGWTAGVGLLFWRLARPHVHDGPPPVRELPPDRDRGPDEADPTRIRADVTALADGGPRSRAYAPEAMARAQELVMDALRDAGWEPEARTYRLRFAVTYRDVYPHWRFKTWPYRFRFGLAGANVVAALPAGTHTDPGAPPLVLLAHLDTVARTPGADDNGSGVSVVLEAARLLAADSPSCPVLVAFVDGEETRMTGSRVLARQFRGPARPRGVINLDSVGIWDTTPGSMPFPPGGSGFRVLCRAQCRRLDADGWTADFVFVGWRRKARALQQAVTAAVERAAGPGRAVPVRDPRPRGPVGFAMKMVLPGLGVFDRSDHRRFWAAGIPAVVLTCAGPLRSRDRYHQPSDLPEGITYGRLADLADAITAVARNG